MWNSDNKSAKYNVSDKSNDVSMSSNTNVVNTFISQFFKSNQESAEIKRLKKDFEHKSFSKEKASEKKTPRVTKHCRKHYFNANTKPTSQIVKTERDFRRFKAKYNTSSANILRDWLSVIYSILVLRMNLIKLVLENFSKTESKDIQLQKQILFESKILYGIVKKAHVYSQKKFYYMWTELEKLISNRKMLKDVLSATQINDVKLRGWRTAAAKLAEIQKELTKTQNTYETIKLSKAEVECTIKENCAKLENAYRMKEAEYKQIVEEITEFKKKEIQMRGRILINVKSYKDLKTKRQNLLNMMSEINQLKNNQNDLVKAYSTKIELLKNKIEETEKQIIKEKEESRKIKSSIDNFGDLEERV